MPHNIEVLLSPLHANEKEKAAAVALLILATLSDRSMGNEERSYLDSIITKYAFGNNQKFATFISQTEIAVLNLKQSDKEVDRFIIDCVKNLIDKKLRAEVLEEIEAIHKADKKLSANEIKIMIKVKDFLRTI